MTHIRPLIKAFAGKAIHGHHIKMEEKKILKGLGKLMLGKKILSTKEILYITKIKPIFEN